MDLVLRPLFDFTESIGDRTLLASGVGPGGTLVALVGDRPATRRAPARTAAALFRGGSDSPVRELRLEHVDVRYPMIQPLADGGVLVADARVTRADPANGLVFDTRGRLHRRILLGDGIEHLQVDGAGRAWVGYFDEGIFGNLGWGDPDGPNPIGSAGLCRFDLATGKLDWFFQPPAGGDHPADWYAVNVADDAVWGCYYTEFDIVRIDGRGAVRRWPNTWAGAKAIAVSGSSVLLVGSYEDHGAATLRTLAGREPTRGRRVDVRRADRDRPVGRFTARGDVLFEMDGPQWWAASIRDIAGDPEPGEPDESEEAEPVGRPWWDHVRGRHT